MIQNDITFSNVKTNGFKKQGWPVILNNQQGPDEEGGIINAVDIDWNEAEFKNAIEAQTLVDENNVQTVTPTITSTGDLIKILAKQQKQIDALIVMVKGLYQGLLSSD